MKPEQKMVYEVELETINAMGKTAQFSSTSATTTSTISAAKNTPSIGEVLRVEAISMSSSLGVG